MPTKDYIIDSLQIANVCIDNFCENEDTLKYEISTKPSEQTCPCCGKHTSRVHDYRKQTIKDLPIHYKKVVIVLKKRRYVCLECGKKFYEEIQCLGTYQRCFNRVKHSVWIELHSSKSMKDIAKSCGVSQNFVQNCLDKIALPVHYPDEVIGIDEFKGDANGERFQVIITDPQNKRLASILPDRIKFHLFDYFNKFPHKEAIKVVTMDMYRPYYDVTKMCFPNATIVIDRYHFVRQVTWAVENVRKEVQKHLCKEDRLYFKHSKKLLVKAPNALTLDEKETIYVMFSYSEKLREIYDLKNWFYEVLKNKDLAKAKEELKNWLDAAKETKIKELKECIRAFTNWFNEICNGIVSPYSNAFTEGKNNKTKVLKRNCYGIRTYKNLEKRIMLINEPLPYTYN